jgi:HPt (histidine-containing phosphotransfer) domain-containing protein
MSLLSPAVPLNTKRMTASDAIPQTITAAELDLAVVRERIGHDERILGMLARYFVQDAPVRITELREAVAAHAPEQIQRIAHDLKGMAANLEAREMRATAQRIETLARDHQDAGIDDLVVQLEGRVARALELLSAAKLARQSTPS